MKGEGLDGDGLATKRILITGADGMLGRGFQTVLRADFPAAAVLPRTRHQLDVTVRDAVLSEGDGPIDVIIHCAADVDADRCERYPAECRKVQVEGTKNVIDLARGCGALILYPQSFLIYGECEGEVDEETPPDPRSIYARCKLEAELLLRAADAKVLIVRMGGFFGGEGRDKNFVGKFTRHLAAMLQQGTKRYGVGARLWQPTFTEDLASNSLALLAAGQEGVWCMSCDGVASFHDVACECVRQLELDHRIIIDPVAPSAVPVADIARRPGRVVMSNQKLKGAGLYLQRHWQDALSEYLKRSWFENLFRRVRDPAG
jgi:dTDP-4-dehydrorhamnose reductase